MIDHDNIEDVITNGEIFSMSPKAKQNVIDYITNNKTAVSDIHAHERDIGLFVIYYEYAKGVQISIFDTTFGDLLKEISV